MLSRNKIQVVLLGVLYFYSFMVNDVNWACAPQNFSIPFFSKQTLVL